VPARRVQAAQARVDLGPLAGRDVRSLAERDPRVGSGEPELDPVERPLLRPFTEQRLAALGAGRRASASVTSSSPTTSTDSIASTPARVRSVPPAFTVGRRQRRKASVTSPSPMRRRTS